MPAFLCSLPVWAEEATEVAEVGKKEGLPQLDPALFPEQIFWLAVTFATLYVLMAYVALPRVAKTQSNRKRVITAEIESARKANEAAKASLVSVEKALREARENAHGRVSEMLAEVAEEANGRRAAQEKELLRKLHTAEADIATTRTAALAEMRSSAEDLAAAVVEKILGSKSRRTA
ncbi:MAG: hypothetical protein WC464_02665 [Bdellovibrionales bacterium]